MRFPSPLGPSRRRRLPLIRAALWLALVATPSFSHDFWIEPTTFRPALGVPVGLGLRVGEHYTGDALARDGRLLRRFVVSGPEGEMSVQGVDGRRPAGLFAPSVAGLYVVGYESGDTVAEMTQEKLAQYFEEEGLAPQLGVKSSYVGSDTSTVKDAFSRCAKAIVLVPGGPSSGYDRRLGLPLELVPLADPHRLEISGEKSAQLPLELLWHGQPQPGVKVTAISRDDPLHPVTAWTDPEGRVRLPIGRSGDWLIKAVRIEATKSSDADYKSVWASLTFELTDLRP